MARTTTAITPTTQPIHLLSLVASHILRTHRFTSTTASAHLTLTAVLERYLCVLAAACVARATAAGRSRVGMLDVVDALEAFGAGQGLNELGGWVKDMMDEETGSLGVLGVSSGTEALREHLAEGLGPRPIPVPLHYAKVHHRRSRRRHHIDADSHTIRSTSPTLSVASSVSSSSSSSSVASHASRKRKRGYRAEDTEVHRRDVVDAAAPWDRQEDVDMDEARGQPRRTSEDGARVEREGERDGSRSPQTLPWLPPIPPHRSAEPSRSHESDDGRHDQDVVDHPLPPRPTTPAPATPLPTTADTPRPRSSRSMSYAPTPAAHPHRPALHAYLAEPTAYSSSMLAESYADDDHLLELKSRVDKAMTAAAATATGTATTTTTTTTVPRLLPSTLPYLVEAYESVVDGNRQASADGELEAGKGSVEARMTVADVLARTTNHPMAYSGAGPSEGVAPPSMIGSASAAGGGGTLAKGCHFIPSYPLYEDGAPAEDAYPIKRVATTNTSYTPMLAMVAEFRTLGDAAVVNGGGGGTTGTTIAPHVNPTDPLAFRPLRALVSQLPGRMSLARPTPQSTTNFWFEPHHKRSEWLTPDVLEGFTYMNPPKPLIGKKGTEEEDRKLIYGEGFVAPGWSRDMKIPPTLRMEDDLPSNIIPNESSSFRLLEPAINKQQDGGGGVGNRTNQRGGGGRWNGSDDEMEFAGGVKSGIAGGHDDRFNPAPVSQPMITLKSTWDIKDRGNWRVWVKTGSKAGRARGRVLSTQEGQMLDINVKGEDVEEELEDEDEDEGMSGGVRAPSMTPLDAVTGGAAQSPNPGPPRFKLVGFTRPSPSTDGAGPSDTSTPVVASTPRLSLSMPPPPPPQPSSSAGDVPATPAPFKLKFKLGTPATPSLPGANPAKLTLLGGTPAPGPGQTPLPQREPGSGQTQDYFSLSQRDVGGPSPSSASNE